MRICHAIKITSYYRLATALQLKYLLKTRKPRKGAAVIDASMHGFASCRKFKSLDLDLGSGQDHINIHSICSVPSVPNHVTVASRSTEICGHLNVVKYRHSVKFEL